VPAHRACMPSMINAHTLGRLPPVHDMRAARVRCARMVTRRWGSARGSVPFERSVHLVQTCSRRSLHAGAQAVPAPSPRTLPVSHAHVLGPPRPVHDM
jgi:hypothetical protein